LSTVHFLGKATSPYSVKTHVTANQETTGDRGPPFLSAHTRLPLTRRLPPGPKRTARLQRKESFVADQTDFSHDAEGRRGRRCSCTTTRPTSSMLTRLRDAHSEAGDTSTHAVSQVNIFGSRKQNWSLRSVPDPPYKWRWQIGLARFAHICS